MLTFIKESRDELRDTHEEIEREQEVLRDTSDLLGGFVILHSAPKH